MTLTMLRQNKNLCGETNDAVQSHLPALGEETADIPDQGPDSFFISNHNVCC